MGEETLEAALAKAEGDAAVALKAAKKVVSVLGQLQKAAQQGEIRKLRSATEALKQNLATLDQESENVADSWQFDEEHYLREGGFTKELLDLAKVRELDIVQQDDRLYCYPMLLRVMPGDRAVKIDKSMERRLRPSLLVELLLEEQQQESRFKPERFLDTLYTVYQVAIRSQGREHGSVVPLTEIYELLTLMPGTRSEYGPQEFIRDVYLLDQSTITTTQARLKQPAATVRFDASTALKSRGGLSVVTQSGAERRYFGISFGSPRSED